MHTGAGRLKRTRLPNHIQQLHALGGEKQLRHADVQLQVQPQLPVAPQAALIVQQAAIVLRRIRIHEYGGVAGLYPGHIQHSLL